MGKLEMPKNKVEVPEDLEMEIYNDDQKWWVNVEENCTATIKQFEDSLILQEHIRNMAKEKIKELSTK